MVSGRDKSRPYKRFAVSKLLTGTMFSLKRFSVSDLLMEAIIGQEAWGAEYTEGERNDMRSPSRRQTENRFRFPYDQEFAFEAEDRYIVCVGAVGYSRDGWRRLRYAIYDDSRDTITFHAPDGPILAF